MPTLLSQRDLVTTLKKETCLHVSLLSKIYPMPLDLSRQILKEDALEKPTQPVFMHLSYYLVCIVDPQKANLLTWPLYDSRAERSYRTDLSNFIVEYSKLGLLTPVMSSYFVNPGCFKVVKLMFELSLLAVQTALKGKIFRPEQQKLYDDVTQKFKAESKEDFVESMEKKTKLISSKFSRYLMKKKLTEEVAQVFRKKIVENENKLKEIKKKKLLEALVDGFLTNYNIDPDVKIEIEKLKMVNKACPILEVWLSHIDDDIAVMESQWENNMSPFITLTKTCQQTSEALIKRQTNEIDKKSYQIKFNPETDNIDTRELQVKVNSQQKYVLKNIIKEDKLIFPNLIRGFVISICYVLNDTEILDDINKFNDCMDSEKRNYGEVLQAVKSLLNRVMDAQDKLQPTPTQLNSSISITGLSDIPPLPDLSDLKTSRELVHSAFDTFTPINITKHNFNLRRRVQNNSSFAKPKPLITPFHTGPRDDFMKTLISCRTMSDKRSISLSTSISQAAQRVNETIAGCTSNFTKEQIQRLLSTKKGSSTKKNKFSSERPTIKVKKGGLFNESNDSALFRSHSSPNLYEKRQIYKISGRQLSVMQEDIPTLLEVSGISIIENNSECMIPQNILNVEDSRKDDVFSLPATISSVEHINNKMKYLLQETDKIIEVSNIETNSILKERSINKSIEIQSKTEDAKTPQQMPPVKKTSSIEKIINRFKKVRASVVSGGNDSIDFKTIIEEKENNFSPVNIDVQVANRMLLPDLLSPNHAFMSKKITELDHICFEMDEVEPRKKPRESLGTALGVDHTVLDQFDLLD